MAGGKEQPRGGQGRITPERRSSKCGGGNERAGHLLPGGFEPSEPQARGGLKPTKKQAPSGGCNALLPYRPPHGGHQRAGPRGEGEEGEEGHMVMERE